MQEKQMNPEEFLSAVQDLQVKHLQLLIDIGRLTRADVANHMHVTKRTVDSWMLPADSEGRRHMQRPQTERLAELLEELTLEKAYGVCQGTPAANPVVIGADGLSPIEFPAVFRRGDKSRPDFSFEKNGPEVRHLGKNSGPKWLQLTPHRSMKNLESFVQGMRLWRSPNPFDCELLSCCVYLGRYFSLVRLAPHVDYREPAVIAYGSGEARAVVKRDEDPLIMFDRDGRPLKFEYDIQVVK